MLEEALDFEELEIDELELGAFDELDWINELELDSFDELETDLTDERELFTVLDLLDELMAAALDDTPEPFVGIEHSFVVLAGLGSTPKVAVLHTNVPFSTL